MSSLTSEPTPSTPIAGPCQCERCQGDQPTAEEEAEFREWAAACHAKEHLQGDRLTLRALVERQRDFYCGWANDAGDMIADHLDELARLLAVTDAATPAEHFARIDALDRHYS